MKAGQATMTTETKPAKAWFGGKEETPAPKAVETKAAEKAPAAEKSVDASAEKKDEVKAETTKALETTTKAPEAKVTVKDQVQECAEVAAQSSNRPPTKTEVKACQAAWAKAITDISKVYLDQGDFVKAAGDAAGQLYGYGQGKVLFKPTKAAEHPFRPTAADAMSYFVGGASVEKGYKEDKGFAINGGQGWEKVEFDNHKIQCFGDVALAMGSYVFTCATSGLESKVEYTFGYKRNDDDKVRICLHHSSLPYVNPNFNAPAVSVEDVKVCQAKWANAITHISKVYLNEGDFVKAAGDAAGELYGYGITPVLFKPTKAAKVPFRPEGADAMSYFVGNSNVEGGHHEDAGFAINDGKGWKNVQFINHDIACYDNLALAMGQYVFTCAQTGEKSKVEYTFGYNRNPDGQVRICLHHSSVKYNM